LLRNIMLDGGVGAGLRFARYNGRTARGTAMGAGVSALQFSQRIGNQSGGCAQVDYSLKIQNSGKRHEGKSRSVSFAFGRSCQTPPSRHRRVLTDAITADGWSRSYSSRESFPGRLHRLKLLSPELRHKLLIHRSFSHVIDVVAQSFHRYGKDDFQYFDGYILTRGTPRSACRTRVPD
jgi:hypothetical protein